MSNNASLTPIKDLKPFKTKWRCQVKLLHSWMQNTGFGGETLQMVLTDDSVSFIMQLIITLLLNDMHCLHYFVLILQGEKISATCKRNNVLSVQRKLPLGKWRVLTTFSVSQASGQYRPTTHPYKMTISDETVITNSDIVQDSIFLSLARYADIIDGTLKTHLLIGNTYMSMFHITIFQFLVFNVVLYINFYFLIDVMGKIVSLQPVQIVQVKGQDRKKVQFRLVDEK